MDLQVNGVFDEGSPEWAIRTISSRGDLVPYPFVYKDLSLTNIAATDFAWGAAFGFNSDMTGGSCLVSLAGGGNYARMATRLRGRTIGVRWTNYNVNARADFCCVIDGVAYLVPATRSDLRSLVQDSTTWTELSWVCPDLLPDTEHLVELYFLSDVASTRTWNLLGWLVEERAGYRLLPQKAWLVGTPFLLAASATTFNVYGVTDYKTLVKMVFYNDDASDRLATLTYGSTVWWQANVPTKRSVEFDPGQPIGFDTVNWKAHAAAANVVRCAVFGRHF